MFGLVRCRKEFSLVSQAHKYFSIGSANFSTDLETEQVQIPPHRTDQDIARNHSQEHVGKFFNVDPKIVKLFGTELIPKDHPRKINYFAPRLWTNRNKVFGETSIMVRSPAVEIINCIKQSDLEQPTIRYVLHGKEGNGKRITLSHLKTFGYQEDFVVMPFPSILAWLTRYNEVAPSTFKPGRIDHIANSNVFLRNFRQINADRLGKCVTHKDYSWSSRDTIKAGSNLLEVVDLGCDRLNFAADVLNVLIKELKMNCNDGNCKLMVTIEGVNCLFAEYTMIHKLKRFKEIGPYPEDGDWMRNRAKVDECSVLVNMKKLFRNDYKNGVVIATVDRDSQMRKVTPGLKKLKELDQHMVPDTRSHLPFALLGETGWSAMNPFYPVAVDKYTQDEMDSAVDYYLEKGYIRQECGEHNRRQELHFITGRIPNDFFNFSSMY